MPSNPLPLDAAARDELARLATETRDAWNAYAAAPDTAAGNAARVDYLTLREDFKAACSPDVILALLAAVERGEAETARLDWLFSDLTSDEINAKVEDVESAFMKLGRYDHDAFRAAIDAARAHPPIQETDADAK